MNDSVKRTRAFLRDGSQVEACRGVVLRPILVLRSPPEQVFVRASRWRRYTTRDGYAVLCAKGDLA